MKALDPEGRSLEEVVRELTDIYYPVSDDKATLKKENLFLQKHGDEVFVARVIVQRLKGELCKYLSRSRLYSEQIEYIREKIREIEDKYPELKQR